MRKRSKQLRCTEEEREIFKRIQKQCDKQDIPLSAAKRGWAKSKSGTIEWVNPMFDNEKFDYFSIRDEVITELQRYAPKYDKIIRPKKKDPSLLYINLADVHFNKLCEDHVSGGQYDLDTARERVFLGISKLLSYVSHFPVEQTVLVIGNDMLNSDTPQGTTTSGTPQDNDRHWSTAFNVAKNSLISLIEVLLGVSDTHVIHCPSNHDYQTGFFLADTIKSWFHEHPNLTWDVSMRHRKYYEYGSNMIMSDHGDGVKVADTPLLMAQEMPDMWGRTRHRYSYKGHVHHKDVRNFQKVKEYHGVTVEHLNSPTPADEWHDRNGYKSAQAMECALHDKYNGKFGHFTHRF